MIWKSANVLDRELQGLDQKQIIEVFVTAIDQGDINIAGKTIDSGKDISLILKKLGTIKGIRVNRIEKVKENIFRVDLYFIVSGSNKEIHKNMLLTTRRINSCWKIDPQSLEPLIYF
jgi:hypothetical protein